MDLQPYIILCSGQSNMARLDAVQHWNAPTNLQVWNYAVNRDGEAAGSGFNDPDTNAVNYGTLYGAEIAKSDPSKLVYVINISRGATNLCQWLTAASGINMWNAMTANVVAAFSHIENKKTIDELIWWGHESDASHAGGISAHQFCDDFLTVLQQIDNEPWGGEGAYRVRLHKIHPGCNALFEQINFGLELIVRSQPSRVSVVDTTDLSYSDGIHLDGHDKEKAAQLVVASQPSGYPEREQSAQPNFLINGAFLINQRSYKNGEVLEAGQFGHDRWQAGLSGASYTVDRGVISLNPKSAIVQIVDSPFLAGKIVTVSVENLSHDINVKVDDQTVTITAGSGQRQASFRIVKVASNHNPVEIIAGDQVSSFSNVKLEVGGACTRFSDIDFHQEHQRCLRYYWEINSHAGEFMPFGQACVYTPDLAFLYVQFAVEMRDVPKFSHSGLHRFQMLGKPIIESFDSLTMPEADTSRGTISFFKKKAFRKSLNQTRYVTAKDTKDACFRFDAEI